MKDSFFDTHCHIQEADPAFSDESSSADKWRQAKMYPDEILQRATAAGVDGMICVGTSLADSEQAVRFAAVRPNVWASIGIHPQASSQHLEAMTMRSFEALATHSKVIAVGECGLDYFYDHSPKADQIIVLERQLDIASRHDLPVIFHTREAFVDFWPIFDNFPGLHGVLHSFTDSTANLEQALERNLYIGVNGIATFSKMHDQQVMYQAIPLSNLLLETDAPYLTPKPFRGTICLPEHVVNTAEYLAQLRSEPIANLAAATSRNASDLFRLQL